MHEQNYLFLEKERKKLLKESLEIESSKPCLNINDG